MSNIENNIAKLRTSPAIDEFLNKLVSCGPTLILGGAVRDWMLDKPYRDVDIVVECSNDKIDFLKKYKAELNRFKGYFLTIDGVDFDVWTVESTWALTIHSEFEKKIDVIPKTVFLSTDAVGYRLDSQEIYDAGFHQTVASKYLDIVFEPNPYPFVCVTRALLALVKYDLRPSDNLIRYIDEQISRGYNKKSFDKFLELRKLKGDFEEAMRRVSHG